MPFTVRSPMVMRNSLLATGAQGTEHGMGGRGPILRSVGRWGGGISHTGRALQDAADGLGHVDAGGGEGEGGVRRAAGAAVHRRQGGGTSPYRAGGGGGCAPWWQPSSPFPSSQCGRPSTWGSHATHMRHPGGKFSQGRWMSLLGLLGPGDLSLGLGGLPNNTDMGRSMGLFSNNSSARTSSWKDEAAAGTN